MNKFYEDRSRDELLQEIEKLRAQVARTELRLRANHQDQVTTFLESITDAFIMFDRHWRVVRMNKRSEQFLHVQSDDLMGKVFWDVFSEAVDTIGYRELHRAVADQVVGFCHKDKEGTITQLVGTFKDITEHKKIIEINQENEGLIYANKVKSEFMTIMSHELRTPLTSIIGFSKLLQEKLHGDLNEKQEYYVDNILKGSAHLLDLINSVLDIASIEAGKMDLIVESIPVADTIEEIVDLLRGEAKGRNIILKMDTDPKLNHIAVDRQKFKQIMFNLLSNAVKFSKEAGGTITITAKKDNDMAQISVADTGIGIRKKDMEKLFHRFEQLDSSSTRKYEGTGLGLSITKELIELLGGEITVKSKYRKGSTFTIKLPISHYNEPEKDQKAQ